jgi:hypothetical protein
MDVFEKHQTRIALDTLKMPPEMVGVMGGPSREEAIAFLESHGYVVDGDTAHKVKK